MPTKKRIEHDSKFRVFKDPGSATKVYRRAYTRGVQDDELPVNGKVRKSKQCKTFGEREIIPGSAGTQT
jgi:hypothetical protein